MRSITHYVNKLKVQYIFCFSRPIQDDPTASKVTFFRSKTTRAMRFVGRSQSGNQLEEQRTMVTSANSASRNLDNQLKTRRKVAKMLIAVVIMFSINFFPVHFLPVLNVRLLDFFSNSKYRISSYSFRGNYSFLKLEIQRSQYIKVWKLFKGGNYSRAETI